MVTALREKYLANKSMKMADGRTWESPTDDPIKGSRSAIVNMLARTDNCTGN